MNQTTTIATQSSPSIFGAFAVTLTNLFGTVNTTANLLNRTVNTIDQYAQTVERHAVDHNYSSQLVSAKRREQMEQQYALLTPQEKAMLKKATDIFADVPPEKETTN